MAKGHFETWAAAWFIWGCLHCCYINSACYPFFQIFTKGSLNSWMFNVNRLLGRELSFVSGSMEWRNLKKCFRLPQALEWEVSKSILQKSLGLRMNGKGEGRHWLIWGKAGLQRTKFQTHFFSSIFNPEYPHYQVWKVRNHFQLLVISLFFMG